MVFEPVSKKPGHGTRITIRDVAKDANVSVASVSKVLRNEYGVSSAMKERVERSIERLNYRPHASARGMRGRTYSLGIVLSDIVNPFFSEVLNGIHNALDKTPYHPLLGTSMNQGAIEEQIIESMTDRQMDGLILISPHLSEAFLDRIAGELPVLTVGYHQSDSTSFDTVNTDDWLGAKMAVHQLIESGRSDIVMLSTAVTPEKRPRERTVTHKREVGYAEAMEEAGFGDKIRIVRASHELTDTDRVVRELLSSEDRPEALFCWADFFAFKAIGVAVEYGLNVPGDLAVVGFDDTMHCRLAQNDLTSVNQLGTRLGEIAASALIERIEGRTEALHVVLPPSLSVRGSSQPVPRRTAVATSPRPVNKAVRSLPAGLRGVLGSLVTPFDGQGEIDVSRLSPIVDRAIDAGLHMLVTNGNPGESFGQTPEEALTCARGVAGLIKGRTPLLFGVGRSTGEARVIASAARDAGADGLVIHQPLDPLMPPLAFADYVRQIRDWADGLPLVLGIRNADIGIAGIQDLCAIENVAGLIWAVPDPMLLAAARAGVPSSIALVGGLGEAWAPVFYAVGARGFVSGLANIWPERSVAVHEAVEAGDYHLARSLVAALQKLDEPSKAELGGLDISIIKAALALQGRDCGPARPPMLWPLPPEQANQLADFLRINGLPVVSAEAK